MAKTNTAVTVTPAQTTPPEKCPDLRQQFDKLRLEKEQLCARSEPLRAEREKLLQQIRPVQILIREYDEKIRLVEEPRMGELDRQISMLARAMGGRAMSDNPK